MRTILQWTEGRKTGQVEHGSAVPCCHVYRHTSLVSLYWAFCRSKGGSWARRSGFGGLFSDRKPGPFVRACSQSKTPAGDIGAVCIMVRGYFYVAHIDFPSSETILEVPLVSEHLRILYMEQAHTVWPRLCCCGIVSWVSLPYVGVCSRPSPFWRGELAFLCCFTQFVKGKGDGEVLPWVRQCQPRAVQV